MAKTMKHYYVVEPGKIGVIEEPIPQPDSGQVQVRVRVHQAGDQRDVAEVFVRRARAARFDRLNAVAADGDGGVLQRRAGHREHPPGRDRSRLRHDQPRKATTRPLGRVV